jgi:hypothetical protein
MTKSVRGEGESPKKIRTRMLRTVDLQATLKACSCGMMDVPHFHFEGGVEWESFVRKFSEPKEDASVGSAPEPKKDGRTCSYHDSEEMPRHAPLCELSKRHPQTGGFKPEPNDPTMQSKKEEPLEDPVSKAGRICVVCDGSETQEGFCAPWADRPDTVCAKCGYHGVFRDRSQLGAVLYFQTFSREHQLVGDHITGDDWSPEQLRSVADDLDHLIAVGAPTFPDGSGTWKISQNEKGSDDQYNPSLRFEFETKEARENFLTWFLDGAGDQQFWGYWEYHAKQALKENKAMPEVAYFRQRKDGYGQLKDDGEIVLDCKNIPAEEVQEMAEEG